jgi:hypothetical protein
MREELEKGDHDGSGQELGLPNPEQTAGDSQGIVINVKH